MKKRSIGERKTDVRRIRGVSYAAIRGFVGTLFTRLTSVPAV
jgi:hypothetical protein